MSLSCFNLTPTFPCERLGSSRISCRTCRVASILHRIPFDEPDCSAAEHGRAKPSPSSLKRTLPVGRSAKTSPATTPPKKIGTRTTTIGGASRRGCSRSFRRYSPAASHNGLGATFFWADLRGDWLNVSPAEFVDPRVTRSVLAQILRGYKNWIMSTAIRRTFRSGILYENIAKREHTQMQMKRSNKTQTFLMQGPRSSST